MSVLLIDSAKFYTGGSGGQCTRRFTSITDASRFVITGAASLEGGGFRLTSSGANMARRTLTTTYASFYAGFRWYYDTNNPNNNRIFEFVDSSSVQCGLGIDPGARLFAYRSTVGTKLGTATGIFLMPSIKYFIEIAVTISDTSGVFTLYVNGASVLSLTSQDTKATANAFLDGIQFCAETAGPSMYFGDFYADDAAVLGDRKVTLSNPNGDSAVTFTPTSGANYTNVDDGSAGADDDTTTCTAASALEDLYDLESIPGASPSTVNAVQVTSTLKKTDAAACTARNRLNLSATYSNGATVNPSAGSYAMFSDIFTAKPGGGSWSGSDFASTLGAVERLT